MEKNRKNIMIVSYIMFAYMGIAFLSQGALKLEIAKSFGITTSELQYLFTIFSTASMIMVVSNKFLLEKISIKMEILASSLSILIGVFLMVLSTNTNFLMIGLTLGGLGIGIYISLASYLIINTFSEDRNRKLNFLHFTYSLSAVLTPMIAAILIGLNLSWNIVYIILLSFVVFVMILGAKTDFREITPKKEEVEVKSESKWGIRVYLSALLLFLYVFSEMIFSYWIVEYMIDKGARGGEAKISLSIFWLFIAIGRFLVGKYGNKFKVSDIVVFLLTVSFISYFSLMFLDGVFGIYVLVGILGLGFSSLYPSIVSLGTEDKKNVSPSLMTFIMMSGSIGGIAYSPISGWINSNYTIEITMGVGVITTLLMLLIGIILKLKNK
ncbi:MAG: hypothetical protein DSY38_00485 [Fusobacteria bacterium]|nr:MAG: hypothetical protein DSY38_00485 [Fusobacteriota bacterium]